MSLWNYSYGLGKYVFFEHACGTNSLPVVPNFVDIP